MRYTIVIALLFIAGCAASVVYSNKGEKLYNEKCGGCHQLYPKAKFSSEKWRREIEAMSKKAKLSNEEKGKILKYFTDDKKN
jgi:hypothetical protein